MSAPALKALDSKLIQFEFGKVGGSTAWVWNDGGGREGDPMAFWNVTQFLQIKTSIFLWIEPSCWSSYAHMYKGGIMSHVVGVVVELWEIPPCVQKSILLKNGHKWMPPTVYTSTEVFAHSPLYIGMLDSSVSRATDS